MKKFYFLLIFISILPCLQAQVVINNSSMPVGGDIIQMNTSSSVNNLNYTQTGSAYTWDFSTLSSSSIVSDTFSTVLSTPLLYNVAFSNPFDPAHLATVAYKQSALNISLLQINEGYSFMQNSATRYAQVGLGLAISSVALPMTFNNPEVIYNFPITYNTTDSSDAEFHVSLPSLGYFGEKRHHVNFVDGWGTLYLPGDTFNVMRIKSVINYSDTIYIDTIGFGFGFTRSETQYNWVEPYWHEPVLQISISSGVTTVKYAPAMPNYYGIESFNNFGQIQIYPNPVSQNLHIHLDADYKENVVSISDITGKEVFKDIYKNTSECVVPVSYLAKGLYFIRIENSEQNTCRKFIKE